MDGKMKTKPRDFEYDWSLRDGNEHYWVCLK